MEVRAMMFSKRILGGIMLLSMSYTCEAGITDRFKRWCGCMHVAQEEQGSHTEPGTDQALIFEVEAVDVEGNPKIIGTAQLTPEEMASGRALEIAFKRIVAQAAGDPQE